MADLAPIARLFRGCQCIVSSPKLSEYEKYEGQEGRVDGFRRDTIAEEGLLVTLRFDSGAIASFEPDELTTC